ncbi:PAS domain-containing protein, partial [Candidatus Omnitrophota bacterium]
MKKNEKSKGQLAEEIKTLQRRIEELEKIEFESKITRKALIETGQRWQALAHNIPEIVIISNREGTIQFINHTIDDLSVEEVIGKNIYEYISYKSRDVVKNALEEVWRTGKVVSYEVKGAGHQGNLSWYNTKAGPLKIHGEVVAVIQITRDVTAHKKMEEALQEAKKRLHFLVNNAPCVIYTCEPSANYSASFISENVVSQMGYEPRDFTGTPDFWAKHVHPEDKKRIMDGMAKLFREGFHSHEYRFLHKDGQYRWMLDQMSLVVGKDGKPVEIIGYWIDTTKRKESEGEVQEQKLALDQKNIALVELIGQIELEKNRIKEDIADNINEVLLPILEKLKMKEG